MITFRINGTRHVIPRGTSSEVCRAIVSRYVMAGYALRV